jgi:serine/threonine-protein kinase
MSTPSSADSSSASQLPADLNGIGNLTLVQLVQADQERRWVAERPTVEEYLACYPRLRENAEAVVALLFHEFRLRQRAAEQPQLKEFAGRFPELAEPLRAVLSLNDSIGDAIASAAVPAPATPTTESLPPSPSQTTGDHVGQLGPPTRWSAPPSTAAGASAGMVEMPGYTILGVLGRGGMGVVYKARQTALGRIVALKMILHADHAGKEERRRFQAEAEAVAQLQHPNIIQVYEVGQHDGLPSFSLEFCAGGSLADQLDGTPWEPKRAAALVAVLGRAMHTAHQAGLVHRDLKPGNILLTADGTPKVTDFGLVKRLDVSGGTQTGAVIGTVEYMAPEQAGKAQQVGPAADIYSLGVILYELLTGRPPFKATAADWMDTVQRVVHEEPVPVRRLQPKVPRDIETICHKCLEKEPQKRYESANAMAEDLRRFITEEPVQARPTGGIEKTVRWCRRNRGLAASLAALALSLLFGGIGICWSAIETRLALRDRNAALQREKETALRLITFLRENPSLLSLGKDAIIERFRAQAPDVTPDEAGQAVAGAEQAADGTLFGD